MKINVGCGHRVLDGWTNVDAVISPRAPRPPEIISNALTIPLPDGCADTVMAIHLFEHFYRWEAPKALAEWARLLKPGGLLIMEMPDLVKCAKNLLAGHRASKHPEQMHMWGLYGDPREADPWMVHRWGWTYATVKPVLLEAGFESAAERITEFHSVGRLARDFRVEARKRRSA